MLRDLDPTRRRYRALVLGVDDYDDEDGSYDVGDDLATMHYVEARLRYSDILEFARSFDSGKAQWEAFRGALLKGLIFQRDMLAFLTQPLKRITYVQLCRRGYEEWTYDYVDSKKDVVGLRIDWETMTATVPPDSDALKDQLTRLCFTGPIRRPGCMRRFGAGGSGGWWTTTGARRPG